MYVKSCSIKKHLAYNGKQMIRVFGLTEAGYNLTSGLWSHSQWKGGVGLELVFDGVCKTRSKTPTYMAFGPTCEDLSVYLGRKG